MAFLTKLLDRPANERPFILFPIGYPAADSVVPKLERKPLDDILIEYPASDTVDILREMPRPFVPEDFDVPVDFDGPGFRMEPLGPRHNERDHEAWMSSVDHIQSTPGFAPTGDWPAPMSLEANLSDLEGHARDFSNRDGFTYSILVSDEVIGCVYIYPSDLAGHDADVSSWVRESRAELDAVVWTALTEWIGKVWPFSNPYYAERR